MQTLPKRVAEIELIYKPARKLSRLPQVNCPEDAYTLFAASWDKDKLEFIEQFKVMLLNNANKVLGICGLSTGGTNSTVADTRLVMATALKASAAGIIIAHNHPSGCLFPSKSDINITNKLARASKLMGINLLDHIILTGESFYSFMNKRFSQK